MATRHMRVQNSIPQTRTSPLVPVSGTRTNQLNTHHLKIKAHAISWRQNRTSCRGQPPAHSHKDSLCCILKLKWRTMPALFKKQNLSSGASWGQWHQMLTDFERHTPFNGANDLNSCIEFQKPITVNQVCQPCRSAMLFMQT